MKKLKNKMETQYLKKKDKIKKDVFVKHDVPGQGHRSNFFCMSGKPLSQGTYMFNITVLSEMVQKL